MKFAFMLAEKAHFPVRFRCRMLEVSPAGFYASQRRPESARTARDAQLGALVAKAHMEGRGAYGTPRVHAALKRDGEKVGRKRVARIMMDAGLNARRKRRFVKTTDSNHSNPMVPNVLERNLTTTAPNKAWVTDITYVPTAQGWLFLAVVIDLFSRRIVGWAMDDNMETGLVLGALKMAVTNRNSLTSLIHHSDRGSVYASAAYRAALEALGITPSMSRKGNCWDNAVAESLFSSLKKAAVHDVKFETREEAKDEIFDLMEVLYNRKRLHSTLKYVSPDEFERAQSGLPQAA